MPSIEPPPEVSSTKPYLVRAIYEWCSDNGFTPYLAVAVNEQTRVPMAHVRNGEIVLNVSALATHRLQMTNTEVSFTARFSGVAEDIWVPIDQIVAIYAKETGHGMAFDVPKPMGEPDGAEESPPLNVVGKPKTGKSSAPTRLKTAGRVGLGPVPAPSAPSTASTPSVSGVPSAAGADAGDKQDPPPTGSGPGSGRPSLRRVK
ncbi:MAG: ClpXP protease specificity-enhancing factor [Burkholderiaceae bacterium]